MKEVRLLSGEVTLVDDEDYESVMRHSWIARKGYAICQQSYQDARANVLLHRYIMRAMPGDIIDHINFNTLDNRKENLRFVDKSLNNFHRHPSKNNKSGHKNVHWYQASGKWRVAIKRHGVLHVVGYFSNLEEAVKARDARALELYGEV